MSWDNRTWTIRGDDTDVVRLLGHEWSYNQGADIKTQFEPFRFKGTTIQDGINESTDGDTIIVNPGTYYENLVLNKEVVLKSSVDFESLGSDWYNNETIKKYHQHLKQYVNNNLSESRYSLS